MIISLSLVLGLLGAADPLPTTFECDRLVAVFDLAAARPVCARAGAPGDLAALDRARAAVAMPGVGEDWPTRIRDGLAAAERARAAAPERVVEEALEQHLARLARATLPGQRTPAYALWPLPGLPMPRPVLPDVDDPDIATAADRLERSQQRLDGVRQRLADGGPATLRKALASMEREHAVLEDSLLAALEDTIQKKPELPPTYWLHLAGSYFAVDGRRDDPVAQRGRGLAVLEKLRRTHPDDGASGVAALWLAGFALVDGEFDRARAYLDEAGPFDPGLTTYYEALLDWHAGDLTAARQHLKMLLGALQPRLALHVGALDAELAAAEADAVASARAWLKIEANATDPTHAARARLRAAIAWSDAVARGELAERVPVELRPHTLLHLLSRGQLGPALTLWRVLAGALPTDAQAPHFGFQVLDTLRAAGDDAQADALLAEMARRYAADGPWQAARAGDSGPAIREALTARLDARLAPALAAGAPLDPAGREALGPVVAARLEAVPPPPESRLDFARGLAQAGFTRRAAVMLKRARADAVDRSTALPAARALHHLRLVGARELGEAGRPVGTFLNGPPAQRPMPAEVRALLDAQTGLIELLRPEDAERDALRVERAALRVAFGDSREALDDLQDVANRRMQEPMGLRAIHLLRRAQPDKADAIALRYARRRAGPPEREAALQRLFQAAYGGRGGDQAATLFTQRLFPQAAAMYAQKAAASPPGERAGPHLAEAVSWDLGLHGGQAITAWRVFIDQHPDHALQATALRHLADLQRTMGLRVDAAATLVILAERFPEREDSDAALREAAALRAQSRQATLDLLRAFVRRYPMHADRPAVEARLKALDGPGARVRRPPGKPPTPPMVPCADRACVVRPFWP